MLLFLFLEITNQLEKEEEIERLKTLRLESFKLNPRSSSFAQLHHHHHHKHGNNHHHDHDSAVDSSSSSKQTTDTSSPSTRSNSGATAADTSEPNNNYLGERSHIDSGLGSPSSVSSHSSTDLRSLHESYSDADLAAKNEHLKRGFQLDDIIDFVQNGMNVMNFNIL